EVNEIAHYDPWFLERIKEILDAEQNILDNGLPNDAQALRKLKSMGFSDERLAKLAVDAVHVAGGAGRTVAGSHGLVHDAVAAMAGAVTEKEVRALRHKLNVRPVFKRIDTCAGEFEAKTPYMYSTYEAPKVGRASCRVQAKLHVSRR